MDAEVTIHAQKSQIINVCERYDQPTRCRKRWLELNKKKAESSLFSNFRSRYSENANTFETFCRLDVEVEN